MKKLFAALLLVFGMSAFAQTPPARTEPGPVQELGPRSLEVISVLARQNRMFAELTEYGNAVTGATVQQLDPNLTRYTVSIGECSEQRGCVGRAMLIVDKRYEPRAGYYPPYVYTSRIVHAP